jgi:calcineurin-like phosphoesterase family protein
MPRPPIDWLITDTHFYHEATTKPEFCNRPKNFNDLILRNLRYLVAEQDTLYHLGDVIFYEYDKLKEMLDTVECARKFLIKGNHDRKSNGWWMRNGFDGVFDMVVVGDVLLSHKPQKMFPDGVRINVHGHFHNTDHRRLEPEYNAWYDNSRHRLLAIEHTEYKPVKLVEFAACSKKTT